MPTCKHSFKTWNSSLPSTHETPFMEEELGQSPTIVKCKNQIWLNMLTPPPCTPGWTSIKSTLSDSHSSTQIQTTKISIIILVWLSLIFCLPNACYSLCYPIELGASSTFLSVLPASRKNRPSLGSRERMCVHTRMKREPYEALGPQSKYKRRCMIHQQVKVTRNNHSVLCFISLVDEFFGNQAFAAMPIHLVGL